MKVINTAIELQTQGNPDLKDITAHLNDALAKSGLRRGSATVFVTGSTAAVTTFEFEPGVVQDYRELFQRLVPADRHYAHDDSWGDANGFSHLRAALQGASLTIPFDGGKLLLGTWQQVVIAEFDNRPRSRSIVVQFIGE